MKAVLTLCVLIAALSGAAHAETVKGCSVKVGNETATMQYFSGNTSVGNDFVDFSPCEVTDFAGCTPKSGYVAIYAHHDCTKIYNTRVSADWDNSTNTFTSVYKYSATHSFSSQADDTLTVELKCAPGQDAKVGTMSAGKIKYLTETVCPGYNPNPTTAGPTTASPPTTTEVPTTAVPPTPAPARNETLVGCNTTLDGEQADLAYFGGNTTVGNVTITVNPCSRITFPGCGNKKGYIATFHEDGRCDRVYDEKLPTVVDTGLLQFTTEYISTFSSVWDIAKASEDNNRIFLVVRCKTGDDSVQGRREGDHIYYESETVCPGYNPNETPAPTEAPSKGLSTGIIVGIVIACIAVLIVAAVIIKIKTGGSESEGDYERV